MYLQKQVMPQNKFIYTALKDEQHVVQVDIYLYENQVKASWQVFG